MNLSLSINHLFSKPLDYLNASYYHQPPKEEVLAGRKQEIRQRIQSSAAHSLSEMRTYHQDLIEIFRQSDPELESFLKDLLLWSIQQDQYEECLEWIISFLNLEQLQKQLKASFPQFSSAGEVANDYAEHVPIFSSVNQKNAFQESYDACWHVVSKVFHSLIHIILKTFDFLDLFSRAITAFEKQTALEIVYKLVVIPIALVQLLSPIFPTPMKVYSVAALILLQLSLMTLAYQKWFRPPPHQVVHCSNMLEEADSPIHLIGMEGVVQVVLNYLRLGWNVVLEGPSGSGKTFLAKYIARAEVAKSKGAVRWFDMKHAETLGGLTFGYGEVFGNIKREISGFERQVRFSIDELDVLLINDACFKIFRTDFLRPMQDQAPRFLATVTGKGLEIILGKDDDKSFDRRVKVIHLPSLDDNQLSQIVRQFARIYIKDIPMTKKAVSALVDYAKKIDLEVEMPAKLEKMIASAIAKCLPVYEPDYQDENCVQVKKDYEELKSCMQFDFLNVEKHIMAVNQAREKLRLEEAKLLPIKQDLQKLQFFMKRYYAFRDRYFQLIQLMCPSQNSTLNLQKKEQIEKAYLIHHFYLKPLIKSTKKQLKQPLKNENAARQKTGSPLLTWCIDEDLIKRISKEEAESKPKPKNKVISPEQIACLSQRG